MKTGANEAFFFKKRFEQLGPYPLRKHVQRNGALKGLMGLVEIRISHRLIVKGKHMDQVYIYNYQLLNNLNSETAMNLLTNSRSCTFFFVPEDTSWNGPHRPVLGSPKGHLT
jgi:hypothetical protein